jgi:hypothetical protein
MIQLSFLDVLQGDDVREMDADWIAKEMPLTIIRRSEHSIARRRRLPQWTR